VIDAEIAVVFYAGHGIEIRGENYMIPLGVNGIYTRRDLSNLVKLSDVIAEAEIAKSFGVLFVDACRDNPLKNNIDPTIRSSVTRGLGNVDTPSNILVSFATKAKQVVNDGEGTNSPYTTALKRFISNQEDIRFVIGKVKDLVVQQTKNSEVKQEPTMFGTLGGERYCLSGYCGQKPVDNSEELARLKAENERLRNQSSVVVSKPTPATNTQKWITPSNSVCTSNGGEIYKGICQANWENAKKICSQSGGQLPSREDLHKVIIDCGGIADANGDDEWNKNTANTSYQSCYKAKGFSNNNNNWYWTREEEDASNAWGVNFKVGDGYWDGRSFKFYAICVR